MADKDFKVKTGIDLPNPLPASEGGTGQTSLSNAFNALLPAQSGHANKFLQSDGTNTSWALAFPRGNTASRPGSPTAGDIYVNTETGFIEIYSSTFGWEQVGVIASTVTGVTATNQGSGRAYNNGQASIAFTPGTILGRTYTATSTPGGFTGTASSSPITITGLQSSTQYTYTVVASNNYGTSAASAASAGVTATTVPQAPTIGIATAGNTQANVTFTAGQTGGAAITSYTVTSSPENITASGASSPITVTGLTNGTAYTFTVTATNANGTSLASAASNSITPVAGDQGSIVPLASFTLSSAQADIVFTNIPNTYKNLQIRGIYKSSASGMQLACYFNNTTPSTWFHEIAGSGSGNATAYASNGSYIGIGYAEQNQFSAIVMDVLDYANTNKNKTVRTLTGIDNNGSGYIFMRSSTWPSNNAVSEIKISTTGANNFAQFTSFQLYGIKG
jgi:hypothetical protein